MRSRSSKSTFTVTCARKPSLPAKGSKIEDKRLAKAPSISAVYLSCEASSPAKRLALDPSTPPSVSMMATSWAFMPGTAELTNLDTAAICEGSKTRPGYSVKITEAVGRSCSRTKAEGLGTAKCTRADFTCPIELTLRANSPSRPRK